MASILARQTLRSFRQISRAGIVRPIHSTTPVFKKKQAVNHDDLFSEDLFEAESTPTPQTEATVASSTTASEVPRVQQKQLSPEERERVFNEWLTYIQQRIGRHPEVAKAPRITVFNILLALATTREQVEQVVDIIPKFIASKRHLPGTFPEVFARRCQELHCPDLALKVFGNYPVYNAKLDAYAAPWLLHSLYLKHPFSDVLLAANLISAHGLVSIDQDLACASLLATSCLKHKTPESLEIAQALQPHIKKMLAKVDLSKASCEEDARTQKWAAWALRRANLMRAKKDGPYVDMDQLPLKVKLPSYKPPTQAQAA